MNALEFGEKLRDNRAKKCMTLQQVSSELGITRAIYTKMEKGQNTSLNREMILKIANVLKVPLETLCSDSDHISFDHLRPATRIYNQDKYHAIYELAIKGLKPSDIIAFKPSNITSTSTKIIIKIGNKTAELNIDEFKPLGRYLRDNADKIKKYGVVFLGRSGKLKVENLIKGFKDYLATHRQLTLADVGWVSIPQINISNNIESIEDIHSILNIFK